MLHLQANDESVWQIRHPTISDSYAAILAESPDLVDIFVQGSEPERLLRQVTCGDVSLEKAVVIPRVLFPQMLLKLEEMQSGQARETSELSDFWINWNITTFLSSRCSAGFLELYLERNPTFSDELYEPGSFHIPSAEVGLAARLHQFGLLPNQHRETLAGKASKEVLLGEGCDALNDRDTQCLFTEEELGELLR